MREFCTSGSVGAAGGQPPAATRANDNVADLILVPEKDSIYAATHGQGIWALRLEDDD